jgi:hypothetical protein
MCCPFGVPIMRWETKLVDVEDLGDLIRAQFTPIDAHGIATLLPVM